MHHYGDEAGQSYLLAYGRGGMHRPAPWIGIMEFPIQYAYDAG
jgi:hypothetical protein